MKKIIVPLLLFIGGCNENPLIIPTQAGLNQEFSLRVNQQAVIQGTNIYLTFRRVTGDSRCPDNARCIWAGNAELVIDLKESPQPPVSVTINTYLEPTVIRFSHYQVHLVKLTPYPHAPDRIDPDDYTATLRVNAN